MDNFKQISLPIDHFRRVAKKEYRNWQEALIREFAQNSVDAGATEVRFNYDSAAKILTVIDNGGGMDLETCESVLLTMGGSKKDSDDAIGGFGIAKQILYFAWPDWELLSQNWRITGKGCYYSVHSSDKYVKGVTSVIRLDEESEFSESHGTWFLQRCQSSSCRFFWNDKEILPYFKNEKVVRDLGWAKLSKDETMKSAYLYVRANGVLMFSDWVFSDATATVTLDLIGDTRSMLTSNRDGLKDPWVKEYATLVQDLTINGKSALRSKDETSVSLYPGFGNTSVHGTNKVQEVNAAREALNIDALRKVAPVARPMATSVLVEAAGGNKVMDRPDILVKTVSAELPKEFNPVSWSYWAKNLMALWRLVLMQVHADSGVSCSFGVGFIFDEDVEAQITTQDGIPFYLINPLKMDKEANLSNKWYLVQDLKSKAVHEIAHFARRSANHDEAFVCTLHLLDKNTWKSEKTYRDIAKLRKISFVQ